MLRLSFVLLAFALPAAAQSISSINQVVSAAEARKELFGVFLSGTAGLDNAPWSECIEPDGRTVYRFRGVELVGQMSVRDNGLVCFDYGAPENMTRNCFRASRSETGGYVFYGGAGAGGVFEATDVQRDVQTCPKSTAPMG